MHFDIPYGSSFDIDTLVLDLNGTLSIGGEIPLGIKEKLSTLKGIGYKIILFTGDQRGTAAGLCRDLGIEFKITQSSKEKESEFLKLDTKRTASIGNARIDIGTFKHARLSILTLQAEGIHAAAIKHCDIIVPSIQDALDLFIDADRLVATLRE